MVALCKAPLFSSPEAQMRRVELTMRLAGSSTRFHFGSHSTADLHPIRRLADCRIMWQCRPDLDRIRSERQLMEQPIYNPRGGPAGNATAARGHPAPAATGPGLARGNRR